MDSRDPEKSCGKIWHKQGAGGKCGRGSSSVCVDVMVAILGSRTVRGSMVGVE
jgi:hypothetical protein